MAFFGPPPQAASALGTKNLVPGSWHQALGLGSPGSWHKDSGFVSVRRDAVRFMSNSPIVRLAVVVRISPLSESKYLSDCPIDYVVRLSELILVSDSPWDVRMTSEIRLSGLPGVSESNSQRPIVQMCPILRINTGVRFEFRFEIG